MTIGEIIRERAHGWTSCDCVTCRKAAQLVADLTKESAAAVPSEPDEMEQLYRYLRARRRG